MINMEKKNMYIVIKRDDAKKYLSQEEIHALVNILGKISNGRMDERSCNEETRSGETGTDQSCSDADSGKKRESAGSGDDDTHNRSE